MSDETTSAKEAMATLELWAQKLEQIISRDYGLEHGLDALTEKYGTGTGGTIHRLARGIAALRAENERLTRELDDAKAVMQKYVEASTDEYLGRKIAEAQVARLTHILSKYGRHYESCPARTEPTETCNCGYDETMEALFSPPPVSR